MDLAWFGDLFGFAVCFCFFVGAASCTSKGMGDFERGVRSTSSLSVWMSLWE